MIARMRTTGRLLPTILTAADGAAALAPPELRAAVLDGDLLPLGDAFLPIDQPAGPAERAASIAHLVGRRGIIAEGSAAWVWGAAWRLAEPIRTYARAGAPSSPPDRERASMREMRLREDDVVDLRAVCVTSPVRTAIDLVRAPDGEFDQACLGRLLAIAGIAPSRLAGAIAARPRLIGRRIALARLQVLFTR